MRRGSAGRTFPIDAGPGVRQRLFEAGGFTLLTGIPDIFATHLHYDHVGGVTDLWIPGWMYGRSTPLRVFGPPGTEEFTAGLQQAYRWDVAYRQIVGITAPGSVLEARRRRCRPGTPPGGWPSWPKPGPAITWRPPPILGRRTRA